MRKLYRCTRSLFVAAAVLAVGLGAWACGESDPTATSLAGMMPDGYTPKWPGHDSPGASSIRAPGAVQHSIMSLNCANVTNVGNVSQVIITDENRFEITSGFVPYHGYNTFGTEVWRDDASFPGVQNYCIDFNVTVSYSHNNLVTTDAGTNPQSSHRWGNLHGTQQFYATVDAKADTLPITVP